MDLCRQILCILMSDNLPGNKYTLLHNTGHIQTQLSNILHAQSYSITDLDYHYVIIIMFPDSDKGVNSDHFIMLLNDSKKTYTQSGKIPLPNKTLYLVFLSTMEDRCHKTRELQLVYNSLSNYLFNSDHLCFYLLRSTATSRHTYVQYM